MIEPSQLDPSMWTYQVYGITIDVSDKAISKTEVRRDGIWYIGASYYIKDNTAAHMIPAKGVGGSPQLGMGHNTRKSIFHEVTINTGDMCPLLPGCDTW